jgi:hypothetical protein
MIIRNQPTGFYNSLILQWNFKLGAKVSISRDSA